MTQTALAILNETLAISKLICYQESLALVFKDLIQSSKETAVQKTFASVDRVVFSRVFSHGALCALQDKEGRTLDFRPLAQDAVDKLLSLNNAKPAALADFIKQALAPWLEMGRIHALNAHQQCVGNTVFRLTNSVHKQGAENSKRLVGCEHFLLAPKSLDGTVMLYSPLKKDHPAFYLHHGLKAEYFDLHAKDSTFLTTLVGFKHTYHSVIFCVEDGCVPGQKEGLLFFSKALPFRKPYEPPSEEAKAST
jgi:hypothetical protein